MSDFTIWGSHPMYCDGTWIALMAGTLPECRNEREFRSKDPRWKIICASSDRTPVFDTFHRDTD